MVRVMGSTMTGPTSKGGDRYLDRGMAMFGMLIGPIMTVAARKPNRMDGMDGRNDGGGAAGDVGATAGNEWGARRSRQALVIAPPPGAVLKVAVMRAVMTLPARQRRCWRYGEPARCCAWVESHRVGVTSIEGTPVLYDRRLPPAKPPASTNPATPELPLPVLPAAG